MKKLIVLLSLYLAACATSVNVDFDKATDFNALKTFFLQSTPVKTAGDARLDSPLMYERIVNAIKRSLLAKGYRESDKADFVVKYSIAVKQEIESRDSGLMFGIGTSTRHTGFGIGIGIPLDDVQSIDRGILTVDIVSAKTGKLLWRGSNSERLYDGGTPEKSDRLINDIVSEILAQFPPGK